MKQNITYLVTTLLLAILLLGREKAIHGASGTPRKQSDVPKQQVPKGNLLTNGSMEEGFYWKYPNHYIANGWKRWWKGNLMPEYVDGHKVGAWDGEHSQRHHVWGAPTTGIYQRVPVTPCMRYQFSMYGLNSSGIQTDHHARVGIDPVGEKLDVYMTQLSSEIVWSPEETFWNTWGMHIVQTEAYEDHITVITYISPKEQFDFYDTYWDAGHLIQVSFPNNRLPVPSPRKASDFITDVTHEAHGDHLTVEWKTAAPAITQIWYRIITPTTSLTQTGTAVFPAIYLPLVINNRRPSYPLQAPIDQSFVTDHQATIEGLKEEQTVWFIILARHPVDDGCRTELSSHFEATMVKPPPPPPILTP